MISALSGPRPFGGPRRIQAARSVAQARSGVPAVHAGAGVSARAELGDGRDRRVHPHDAGVAVDEDAIVGARPGEEAGGAGDDGDAERARQLGAERRLLGEPVVATPTARLAAAASARMPESRSPITTDPFSGIYCPTVRAATRRQRSSVSRARSASQPSASASRNEARA